MFSRAVKSLINNLLPTEGHGKSNIAGNNNLSTGTPNEPATMPLMSSPLSGSSKFDAIKRPCNTFNASSVSESPHKLGMVPKESSSEVTAKSLSSITSACAGFGGEEEVVNIREAQAGVWCGKSDTVDKDLGLGDSNQSLIGDSTHSSCSNAKTLKALSTVSALKATSSMVPEQLPFETTEQSSKSWKWNSTSSSSKLSPSNQVKSGVKDASVKAAANKPSIGSKEKQGKLNALDESSFSCNGGGAYTSSTRMISPQNNSPHRCTTLEVTSSTIPSSKSEQLTFESTKQSIAKSCQWDSISSSASLSGPSHSWSVVEEASVNATNPSIGRNGGQRELNSLGKKSSFSCNSGAYMSPPRVLSPRHSSPYRYAHHSRYGYENCPTPYARSPYVSPPRHHRNPYDQRRIPAINYNHVSPRVGNYSTQRYGPIGNSSNPPLLPPPYCIRNPLWFRNR